MKRLLHSNTSTNYGSATVFKKSRAYVFVAATFAALLVVVVVTSVTSHHALPSTARAEAPIALEPFDTSIVPPTLAHYIEWHKQWRQCIADRNCVDARPGILVWRCLDRSVRMCAGVGDRFRGIQVALMVAIVTKRLFFLEWPDEPYPLLDAIVPSAFDWRFPSSLSHAEWPLLNWFLCPRIKQLRAKCRPPRDLIPKEESLPGVNYSVEFMDTFINASTDDLRGNLAPWSDIAIACRIPASVIEKFVTNPFISPTILDLHPSQTSSVTLRRLLLKILFRPSPAVQSVINSLLPPSFVNAGYVSVHARTGLDYGEAKQDPRFLLFKTNFEEAVDDLMACAKRMHPLSAKRMFLATDSVSFKTGLATLANKSGVDVRYISAKSLHFGLANSKWLLRQNGAEERWQAYINVFADLYMLANSSAIVTTGSGFARLSYWLGNSSSFLVAGPGNGTEHCDYLHSPSAPVE